MGTSGCYAIYRLSDGFVLRTGMCPPGMEAQQVLDPATEGLVPHDRGMIAPDDWAVAGGQLVAVPSRAVVTPAGPTFATSDIEK